MTAYRCQHHIARIRPMPSGEWKSEVSKLPTDCGNADCTTRNCQVECTTRLRMHWQIENAKRAGK
jgi:hypothetical protein